MILLRNRIWSIVWSMPFSVRSRHLSSVRAGCWWCGSHQFDIRNVRERYILSSETFAAMFVYFCRLSCDMPDERSLEKFPPVTQAHAPERRGYISRIEQSDDRRNGGKRFARWCRSRCGASPGYALSVRLQKKPMKSCFCGLFRGQNLQLMRVFYVHHLVADVVCRFTRNTNGWRILLQRMLVEQESIPTRWLSCGSSPLQWWKNRISTFCPQGPGRKDIIWQWRQVSYKSWQASFRRPSNRWVSSRKAFAFPSKCIRSSHSAAESCCPSGCFSYRNCPFLQEDIEMARSPECPKEDCPSRAPDKPRQSRQFKMKSRVQSSPLKLLSPIISESPHTAFEALCVSQLSHKDASRRKYCCVLFCNLRRPKDKSVIISLKFERFSSRSRWNSSIPASGWY